MSSNELSTHVDIYTSAETGFAELLGRLQYKESPKKPVSQADIKKGIPQKDMNQKQREELLKETIPAKDRLYQYDAVNFIMAKISEDTGLEPGRASCNMLALRWIVSNMYEATKNEKKGFRLSVQPKNWTKNFQQIGIKSFEKVSSRLIEHGYLIKNSGTEGYYLNPKTNTYEKKPYVSTFMRSYKFTKLLKPYYMQGFRELADSYIMFKDSDKEIIEGEEARVLFNSNAEYAQQNETLRSLDELLKEGRVFHKGYKKREFGFKRQIIVSGEHQGGRIYASTNIQSLKQCDRLNNLRIDGEDVVELDFASTHPSIIGTLEGVESFDDPYVLDMRIYSKKLNRELSSSEQRNLVKLLVNTALNADEEDLANVVRWMMVCAGVETSNEIVVKLIQEVLTKSPWMEKYIGTGAWRTLQRLDSEIALNVIDQFVSRGEVILPYHDSFIVKASLEKDLQKAMRKAWKEVLGNDVLCKVDKKHADDEYEILHQELSEEFEEGMLFS